MTIKQNSKTVINDSIVKDIRDAIEGLSYGTVIITVHNKRITQIEISKKQRYDDVWKIEGGGGI